MPAFVKAFFGLQAVKSHCPGSTQWDLRDLHGPCVQPDLHWGCSRGVTPEEEAAAPSSCCTIQGNQECVLCSIPHQKQTPQLAPHHPRNLISLSMVLKYRQGNEIAPSYPVGYFPGPVYFSVPGKGKQGTEQLCFPLLLTWRRIYRFIFLTCGFICQSNYIKSNIGFALDGS